MQLVFSFFSISYYGQIFLNLGIGFLAAMRTHGSALQIMNGPGGTIVRFVQLHTYSVPAPPCPVIALRSRSDAFMACMYSAASLAGRAVLAMPHKPSSRHHAWTPEPEGNRSDQIEIEKKERKNSRKHTTLSMLDVRYN